MSIWKIISSDIADKLNRCGTYEVKEIIRAAEDLGYTYIEVEDDTVTATDNTGWQTTIAEQ